MSRNQKIFLDIDSSITSKIQIGNGSIIDVKGKGIISVKTKKGPRHIWDDLYVPDSEHNLFNFGQLIENSYFVHYEDGSCTIFDQKNVVIANVKMNSNRSFPVEFWYGVLSLRSLVVDDILSFEFQWVEAVEREEFLYDFLEWRPKWVLVKRLSQESSRELIFKSKHRGEQKSRWG